MREEKELQNLLYVELPNLTHRILKKASLTTNKSKRKLEITIDEIKKITNAECNSALVKVKD